MTQINPQVKRLIAIKRPNLLVKRGHFRKIMNRAPCSTPLISFQELSNSSSKTNSKLSHRKSSLLRARISTKWTKRLELVTALATAMSYRTKESLNPKKYSRRKANMSISRPRVYTHHKIVSITQISRNIITHKKELLSIRPRSREKILKTIIIMK